MGQAIGGFGATVAANWSWQSTFHSFGIIGIVYSLVLIFFLREKKFSEEVNLADHFAAKEKAGLFKGLSLLFTNISFWIILFYFAIPSLPGWATKNWLPTLFAQNLHIPMSKAGPLSTITIAASSFLGVIAGGILSLITAILACATPVSPPSSVTLATTLSIVPAGATGKDVGLQTQLGLDGPVRRQIDAEGLFPEQMLSSANRSAKDFAV